MTKAFPVVFDKGDGRKMFILCGQRNDCNSKIHGLGASRQEFSSKTCSFFDFIYVTKFSKYWFPNLQNRKIILLLLSWSSKWME